VVAWICIRFIEYLKNSGQRLLDVGRNFFDQTMRSLKSEGTEKPMDDRLRQEERALRAKAKEYLESAMLSFEERLKRMQMIVRHSRLFLVSLAFLVFAFLYGFIVVPDQIRSSGMTKVRLKEEGPSVGGHVQLPSGEVKLTLEQKKTDIQGRVIVRLSHSLLLLEGEKEPRVLVIPEERIEKIETPATRFF
jgi:hypothetical protein